MPSQANCATDGQVRAAVIVYVLPVLSTATQGANIVEPNYQANGHVFIATSRAGGYNGKVTLGIKLKNGGTAQTICDNSGSAATDQCFVKMNEEL